MENVCYYVFINDDIDPVFTTSSFQQMKMYALLFKETHNIIVKNQNGKQIWKNCIS